MQVRDRAFSVFLSSEQAGSFVAATVVPGMPLCNSIKWSKTMKFLFFWKCVCGVEAVVMVGSQENTTHASGSLVAV